MQHRNIAFIGAGNMTSSIISGLIKNGYPAHHVRASNPSPEKLMSLQAKFGIVTSQDNNQAANWAQVIVLAVKPQLMQQVCAALAEHCQLDNKLFVSIAAGIEVNRLQQMLKANHKIIRTMPNTPSALGRGMTGLFAKDDVSRCDRNFAGDLMQQIGEIAWVQNEPMMNVVIAAAGSSPAYFFLFLEAMQKQAEAMGLDHNTARLLIQQSMLGAAEMVCHNPHLELSELRTQVTSKGGTTAQAIASFQGQGLDSIVANAMQAAITRAEHMAQQI